MKNTFFIDTALLMVLTLISCKHQSSQKQMQLPAVSVKTTTVSRGNIESQFQINGKTVYLKKNEILSPVTGYIISTTIRYGSRIQKNDLLFVLQTKEGKVLNSKQSMVKVYATTDGIVNNFIVHQKGDFLVEGALLCSLVNNNDLTIQANVPFEYNHMVKRGDTCQVFLADKTQLAGVVFQKLPEVHATDQTQTVFIKPLSNRPLPQNLQVTIRFLLRKHYNTLIVPKEALMTNEMQSRFWVMKIVHDTLAVKIPVTKGIEKKKRVEINATDLTATDLIIAQGAYGLPDSSVVKIVK